MNMNTEWEKAIKISARIIEKLSEEEQEAIFYLIDRRTITELKSEMN